MKATVILKLDSGDKTLVKEHDDQKVLEEWICKLSYNPKFYMGHTSNGQFAIRMLNNRELKEFEDLKQAKED